MSSWLKKNAGVAGDCWQFHLLLLLKLNQRWLCDILVCQICILVTDHLSPPRQCFFFKCFEYLWNYEQMHFFLFVENFESIAVTQRREANWNKPTLRTLWSTKCTSYCHRLNLPPSDYAHLFIYTTYIFYYLWYPWYAHSHTLFIIMKILRNNLCKKRSQTNVPPNKLHMLMTCMK